MKPVYINGMGCVSAQDTTSETINFEEFTPVSQPKTFVKKPEYKKYIKPAMIRRMATGVKMGVVASSLAIKESGVEMPDAIVVGTGMGCIVDSEKFLKKIIEDNEQFLTPTAFIQSTHNTVGGQIALGIGCKGYNVTYVHDATSFETSLLDAKMQIQEGATNVLVGGVDEIGDYTTRLHDLVGLLKKEENSATYPAKTSGVIYGEGAQFMMLSNAKSSNSYARLGAMTLLNELAVEAVLPAYESFLASNNLTKDAVDVLVLGYNGSVEDSPYFDSLRDSSEKTTLVYYKHLTGEYNSVSAFGFWLACTILKRQEVPEICILPPNKQQTKPIKNIVLYNQYKGDNHSFVLVQQC